jgi:3'-5' exoribonuclease
VDRTGGLDAKMWDNVAEVMETFGRDDFVRVRGLLQIYHNRPQVTLHKLQRISECDIDVADYFPASERSPAEMFAELQNIITSIENPHLAALLIDIFSDERVAERFRTAPAAKSVHHAYLGGLLEHVLSVCELCRRIAPLYKNIDLDLLLTGAILHDVGKIDELTYDRSFGYSTDGQLLGHIIIALRMIEESVRRIPEFPEKLRTLLDHMILSHHGALEYGSPKVPLFPEAMLLHQLDNLDSKMEAMRSAINRDRLLNSCWTGYTPSLERAVLNKTKYMEAARPNEDLKVSAAQAPASVLEESAATSEPVPQPVPQRRPTSSGLFAEKLQSALRGRGEDQQ